MIELPNVTLVCVDCKNHASAIKAILKSIDKISFKEVLFLSDKMFYNENFKTIIIDKIESKKQYSYFMLNKLNDYIHTNFCLVIQYDGYVINPELWNNKFLDYDYIGAPWWYDDGQNVGNGGFSLRSKWLLTACQHENFEYNEIEDNTICKNYRSFLEGFYDIKYATESIAEKFSFEPNIKHPKFNNNTFGFHGVPSLIL